MQSTQKACPPRLRLRLARSLAAVLLIQPAGASAPRRHDRFNNLVWFPQENLVKRFGRSGGKVGKEKVAVNELCLGIDRGECFGLLGALPDAAHAALFSTSSPCALVVLTSFLSVVCFL